MNDELSSHFFLSYQLLYIFFAFLWLGSATTAQPSPLSPQTERTDPPPAVAVRPYVPDHPSRPQSPRKGPATMNSSSIYSMYLQQPQAKNYGSLSNRTTVKAGNYNNYNYKRY